MPVWKMIIVIVPGPLAKPGNDISKMKRIMTTKIIMMSMMKMKTMIKTSGVNMIQKIMMRKMMRIMKKRAKKIAEVVTGIQEEIMMKMTGIREVVAGVVVPVVAIVMMKIMTIRMEEVVTGAEEENMMRIIAEEKEADMGQAVVHAGDLEQ